MRAVGSAKISRRELWILLRSNAKLGSILGTKWGAQDGASAWGYVVSRGPSFQQSGDRVDEGAGWRAGSLL